VRVLDRKRRRNATRYALLALLAVALLSVELTVAPRQTRASTNAAPASKSTNTTPKTYFDANVYLINWRPKDWGWLKPGYSFATIRQFILDMNKSSYSNVLTEYGSAAGYENETSDGTPLAGMCVNNTITGGSGTEANPVQSSTLQTLITGCITGGSNTLRDGKWIDPLNARNIYLLYTPMNLFVKSSISGAPGTLLKNFCGYHWFYEYGSPKRTVVYGVIGSPAGYGTLYCSPGSTFEQSVVRHTSHELFEAITNPFGEGGKKTSGAGETSEELADYCDNTSGSDAGGSWTTATRVRLNGNDYELTGLWSNQAQKCLVARFQPQVSFTLTGPRGNPCGQNCHGWFIGDVTLKWDVRPRVVQPPLVLTKDGCTNRLVKADTPEIGTYFTCTATTPQGSFTVDNEIMKRDATPPELSITHALRRTKTRTLEGRLTIKASDATSGIGTPPRCSDNLDGVLRVAAIPAVAGRWTTSVSGEGTHTVTCGIKDVAGNLTTARHTVRIPAD
jgi:hypothetical protein